MRRYEDPAEVEQPPTPNTFLIQRIVVQPSQTVNNQSRIEPTLPVNNGVAYAQIIRPARVETPDSVNQFDFRLQTPAQNANNHDDNASPLMSGGSSISSGYIDLTVPSTRVQRRNVRPTSPETSF